MTGRRLVAASESAPSEADPSHDCAGGAVSEASYRVLVRRVAVGWISNYEERTDLIPVGPEFGWWRPSRRWAVAAARRRMRRHIRSSNWELA